MSNKERYKLNKPQNNYGGDYKCPNYDTNYNGKEFCHDETIDIHWSKLENGKLICKGNLHNCKKIKYKWLASLPENEKKKYQI
jgi:hypothetical protein